MSESASTSPEPHKRRPRYAGKHPRRFEEKYKELEPDRYGETVAKVMASGKTPAGTHRPIMVAEILDVLAPKAGDVAVDCTLGYGGHAQEILGRIRPGGTVFGLDADPIELPKAEARLRALGFGPDVFTAHRSNFAGLPRILAQAGLHGADAILADLGVSSMQLDNPARGFSVKHAGPLDMRMNPQRGQPGLGLPEENRRGFTRCFAAENADDHTPASSPRLSLERLSDYHGAGRCRARALPHVDKERSALPFAAFFKRCASQLMMSFRLSTPCCETCRHASIPAVAPRFSPFIPGKTAA